MPIIADLHIHSTYSKDSAVTPKKIIQLAEKRGIAVLAVTDHNSLRGGVDAVKEAKDRHSNVLVIPGIEISTNHGHVIGLLIQEEISSSNYFEVISSIKKQAGLVVIPHPTKKSQKFNDPEFAQADLIEGYNGRATKEENLLSLQLGKKFSKPLVAGSDAHLPFEIGKIRLSLPFKPNDFDELRRILLGNFEFKTDNKTNSFLNPYFTHALSVSIEQFRRLL